LHYIKLSCLSVCRAGHHCRGRRRNEKLHHGVSSIVLLSPRPTTIDPKDRSKRRKAYPNVQRREIAMAAARKLASATSVQSGLAVLVAKHTIALSRFAMLTSIVVRSDAS
jgi:hypothetical protein